MSAKNLFDLLKAGSVKEMETVLSETPAAAEAVDEQGVSLLLMAVYFRNKEAISTIRRFVGSLSPWEAACLGDSVQLNKLLENDPSLINKPSPDGFSLLGYACFFNQDDIAGMLIRKGADVNNASQNFMKVAPLHSAAASSNYPLCKLLLENGADVNASQQGGYTPLHAAAQNGQTDLVKLFLEHGADKNKLTDKGQLAVMLANEKSHYGTASLIENF